MLATANDQDHRRDNRARMTTSSRSSSSRFLVYNVIVCLWAPVRSWTSALGTRWRGKWVCRRCALGPPRPARPAPARPRSKSWAIPYLRRKLCCARFILLREQIVLASALCTASTSKATMLSFISWPGIGIDCIKGNRMQHVRGIDQLSAISALPDIMSS